MPVEDKNLDTVFEITVPEYIVFRYETAGPTIRFFAVLIDHLVIAGILFAVTGILLLFSAVAEILTGMTGQAAGIGIFFIFLAFFALYWFYFAFFEQLNRGRTPGKMATGLRVVSRSGTTLKTSQVILRNLLRVADMFPLIFIGWIVFIPTYASGALSLFLSGKSFRRLGDLAAGSMVIRERKFTPYPSLEFPGDTILEIAQKMTMKKQISPSLAQALHDFVSRKKELHPDRLHEIAKSVDAGIRECFGASAIQCPPVELLLAAHFHLYGKKG